MNKSGAEAEVKTSVVHAKYHYSHKRKTLEFQGGGAEHPHGRGKMKRIISWPDPFRMDTWVSSDSTCGPVSHKHVLKDQSKEFFSYQVLVTTRKRMMKRIMELQNAPHPIMPDVDEWVIKEFRVNNPADPLDHAYVAVRTQLIISSVSADTQGVRYGDTTDAFPRYSRNLCPVVRYWKCVTEAVDDQSKMPVVYVYIAMPRATTTLAKYLETIFTPDLFALEPSVDNNSGSGSGGGDVISRGSKASRKRKRVFARLNHCIVQILFALATLQTPELMVAHRDLHTDNILVWLPTSTYYQEATPDYIQTTILDVTKKKDDRRYHIPIKQTKTPLLWLYDFDQATSDRWKGMSAHNAYIYKYSFPTPPQKGPQRIRMFQDIVRIFTRIQGNVADALSELGTSVITRTFEEITQLDRTLYTLTGGFIQIIDDNTDVVRRRIQDRDEYHLLGSAMDLDALEARIPPGVTYWDILSSITPRTCLASLDRLPWIQPLRQVPASKKMGGVPFLIDVLSPLPRAWPLDMVVIPRKPTAEDNDDETDSKEADGPPMYYGVQDYSLTRFIHVSDGHGHDVTFHSPDDRVVPRAGEGAMSKRSYYTFVNIERDPSTTITTTTHKLEAAQASQGSRSLSSYYVPPPGDFCVCL